jgi:hypothetical protein
MARQAWFRGTVANDGTGDTIFVGLGKYESNFTEQYALNSETINAASVNYTGTKEQKIQAAITDAVSQGKDRVYIPSSMLPYDPTVITFSTAVQMVREGGSAQSGKLDVVAYAAVADDLTDNKNAFAAVYGAAPLGATVSFPVGIYRTTLPLPIRTGINQSGDGAIASTIKYVDNGVGTMFDDGAVSISTISENLLFVRVGDGSAVAGATQSARYTVRMRNTSSIFRFNNCWFQDANWNFTSPVGDELTAFAIEDGTAYFLNCYTKVSGRGIYQPSGGGGTALTKYIGFIETTGIKCLAQHAGTTHMVGSFETTGAGTAATISCAGSTVYVSGLVIRSGGTTVVGVFNDGATVYLNTTVRSSGLGFQVISGTIYSAGPIVAVDTGVSQVGGTIRHHGDIATTGANSGGVVLTTGATFVMDGDISCDGIGLTLSDATTVCRFDGKIEAPNGGGVQINGGTLDISGKILTAINGITPSGATAKVIRIGMLDIEITGANTARRGILYTSSTSNTTSAGVLRVSVPAGATSSISTTAANLQTITAGKVLSNVAVGTDITVAAFTYSAP